MLFTRIYEPRNPAADNIDESSHSQSKIPAKNYFLDYF